MSAPLVLAVPAKGRLQENAEAFFARSGLALVKPRGARDYRGAVSGLENVEVAYLSASEIPAHAAAKNTTEAISQLRFADGIAISRCRIASTIASAFSNGPSAARAVPCTVL